MIVQPHSEASAAPQNVQSPVLSADDDRVVLVEKPLSEADKVVDYHVYRSGQLLAARGIIVISFPPPNPINFYQTLDSDNWQHRVDLRTFTVDGLKADSEYQLARAGGVFRWRRVH